MEEEWALIKDGPGTLTDEELDRVSAYFTAPDYDGCAGGRSRTRAPHCREAAVSRAGLGARSNRIALPGYRAVVLSLKKTGVPPGDATAEQMDLVADWSERFGFGEMRVSHEQNLILPDVRAERLVHPVGRGACGRARPRRTSGC